MHRAEPCTDVISAPVSETHASGALETSVATDERSAFRQSVYNYHIYRKSVDATMSPAKADISGQSAASTDGAGFRRPEMGRPGCSHSCKVRAAITIDTKDRKAPYPGAAAPRSRETARAASYSCISTFTNCAAGRARASGAPCPAHCAPNVVFPAALAAAFRAFPAS